MRETTYDVNTDELIEMTVEYCHAILDARSEEELATIKEQIADEIRTNTDYPEEYIQNYMTSLNNAVEKLESGEVTLAEDGEFVRSDENIQEGQEVPVEEPVASEAQTTTMAGVGVGVTMAALVAAMALKKHLLKNSKNKKM